MHRNLRRHVLVCSRCSLGGLKNNTKFLLRGANERMDPAGLPCIADSWNSGGCRTLAIVPTTGNPCSRRSPATIDGNGSGWSTADSGADLTALCEWIYSTGKRYCNDRQLTDQREVE